MSMKSRLKVAEDIVSYLESEWPELTFMSCGWDHDKARRIVSMFIPQAAAEYADEINQAMTNRAMEAGTAGISLFALLREALHAEGLSLSCVLKAALDAVKERDRLLQERQDSASGTDPAGE